MMILQVDSHTKDKYIMFMHASHDGSVYIHVQDVVHK